MISHKKVELLNLGDELLLGLKSNEHLVYLGRMLKRHGLTLIHNEIIRDNIEEIQRSFQQSWERADIVITTGGLGSTVDDNTREALAEALGLKLIFDPEAEKAITKLFEKVRSPIPESLVKQCYKLEGSETLPNRSNFGTAPGIFLKHQDKILIMLPGPTSELRPMFEQEVLPRLKAEGVLEPEEMVLQLRTTGVGETRIEERVKPALEQFPDIDLAFCAHLGIVDVRLSLKHASVPQKTLLEAGEACREALGEDFFTFGNDSLAKVVLDDLKAAGKTLAIAESCTGGLLSNEFTDLPGASQVFSGSIIAYSNDAKVELLHIPEAILEQHGAVSEETALAMATGVAECFSADYALSSTGFAGPEGGTEKDPVGTVYLGFHSPEGAYSRKVVFPGDRLIVKERAVYTALDWIRRKLKHYKSADISTSIPGA
tara:strand:- start:81613 stop:82902 length:1290 start_codon:yes stop_codon:yes gene_type:complete